jgi:hypothetical protein
MRGEDLERRKDSREQRGREGRESYRGWGKARAIKRALIL